MRRLTAIGLLALAGCASGGAGSAPVPARPSAAPQPQAVSARLVITVPRASASTARRSKYVSTASVSLSIVVDSAAPIVQGLLPTSPGCSAGASGTQCTIVLALVPATAHLLTVKAYDGPNATGDVLSENTTTFTPTIGGTNAIPLVLGGVPASVDLAVNPAQTIACGSLTATAQTTLSLAIGALDAAGQTIVGPGSPTIAVTTDRPAFVTPSPTSLSLATTPTFLTSIGASATESDGVGSPASAAASLMLAAGSPATASGAFAFVNGTGIDTYALCDASFTKTTVNFGIGSFTPRVAIGTPGTIAVAPEATASVLVDTAGTASSIALPMGATESFGLAFDPSGSALFSIDAGTNSLDRAALGSASFTTVKSLANPPCGLAVDAKRGLAYVADCANASAPMLTGYTIGGTYPTAVTVASLGADASAAVPLAVGSNGDVAVITNASSTSGVTIAPAPAGTATKTLTLAGGSLIHQIGYVGTTLYVLEWFSSGGPGPGDAIERFDASSGYTSLGTFSAGMLPFAASTGISDFAVTGGGGIAIGTSAPHGQHGLALFATPLTGSSSPLVAGTTVSTSSAPIRFTAGL